MADDKTTLSGSRILWECLEREGVTTVGELVQKSEEDLLEIRNFGQKSIDEVKAKLEEMGLGLRGKEF